MTYYWDPRFLKHLTLPRTIFEVGGRYGDESLELARTFPTAKLYTFECNPVTREVCRRKVAGVPNISFFDHGLGSAHEWLPFYSFQGGNDGASSLLKRIDFEQTQVLTGTIELKTLSDFAKEHAIAEIDLLCMDVQGYELNILKGAGEFLKNIKYVIMEEPKLLPNPAYLPSGVHSKYINAPTSQELHDFMTAAGFQEKVRLEENKIEDNVMYENVYLTSNCFS